MCRLSPQGEQIVFNNGKCSDVRAFIMLSYTFACIEVSVGRSSHKSNLPTKQSFHKATGSAKALWIMCRSIREEAVALFMHPRIFAIVYLLASFMVADSLFRLAIKHKTLEASRTFPAHSRE
jgi:hypothetical protein